MKIWGLITITLRELSAKATLIVLAGISTLIILGIFLSLSSSQVGDGINLMFFGSSVHNLAIPPSINECQRHEARSLSQDTSRLEDEAGFSGLRVSRGS